MMTSTVAPLKPLFSSSRSFDSLCLPSAKDNAAASSVIRAKKANRAPQVVVVCRMLSCNGRFVSSVADISWAPKLPRGPRTGSVERARPDALVLSMLGVSGLAAGQSIVQVGHRCSTKVQPVLGDRDNPGVSVVGIFSVSGEYVSKACTQRARDASAREASFSSLTRNRHVDSLH